MKTFVNVRNICHYFSGLLNRYKIFLLQRATSDKNWSLQICLNFPSTPKTNAWYFSSVLIFSSNPRVLAKNSAHVAYTLLTHRAPRSQGKGKRGRNHPSWRILRACDVIFLLPLLTNHLQFFFSFLKTRVVSLASQLHQLWLIAASV